MEKQEKWDRRFLEMAQSISQWSKDVSTKVGAVIVDDKNRVISVGYNGFPRGIKDDGRLLNREEKLSHIVHAEINAILFANKDLSGCTLYSHPFMPCDRCATQIIQTGIVRVVSVFNSNPRWQDSFCRASEMFKESGVELILYEA